MRRAVVVGVNYYESINISSLNGCVNDAEKVAKVLNHNSDQTINCDVRLMLSINPKSRITRKKLRSEIKELFEGKPNLALFYFSGHGYIENSGGYLITSECKDGHDGLSMNELLQIANESEAISKIIILDCCHAGTMGNYSHSRDKTTLSEGMTILTASSATQFAKEKNGSGVFTSFLVDALEGAAANLAGEITPGSVYAHIDKSLGSFGQRPVFKANVAKFISLRNVTPSISLENLRLITTLFPTKEHEFVLDPSYEPERSGNEPKETPSPNQNHVEQFRILQKYNRLNLLIPKNAPYMWHAAMQLKSCELTLLGKFYWQLVKDNKI